MLAFLKPWPFLVCIFCYKFVKMVKIHLVFTKKITVKKKDAAGFVLNKPFDFPHSNLISIRIQSILSSKIVDGVESNLEWNFAQCFSLSSCISSCHQISVLFQTEKSFMRIQTIWNMTSHSCKCKLILCRVKGNEILVRVLCSAAGVMAVGSYMTTRMLCAQ